ncbi:MAG: DUF488 domain-containing protein [Chthoniobacteraceae bacterium]
MPICLKRAYEPAHHRDGQRILVDRLWPRGVKKEDAALDLWLKDAAPSTALRKWFSHDPKKWAEFQRRYRAELDGHREAVRPLLEAAKKGPVTLVYGAHDQEHNDAVVLKAWLEAP